MTATATTARTRISATDASLACPDTVLPVGMSPARPSGSALIVASDSRFALPVWAGNDLGQAREGNQHQTDEYAPKTDPRTGASA